MVRLWNKFLTTCIKINYHLKVKESTLLKLHTNTILNLKKCVNITGYVPYIKKISN